jgi:hypothetical protein
LSLGVSLCAYGFPLFAGGKPLGILTLAYGAHLNASDAFAGLSVFGGERVSTDATGKIAVRISASVLTLSEENGATLQRAGDGAHLDLDAGSVYVWSAESNPLEVHPEGALLRPHWLAPDAGADSDVCAEDYAGHGAARERGFFVWEGSRVLPEGQTYRIYLAAEDDPRSVPEPGTDAQKAGMSTGAKVAYFILAGAGTGLAAWGIHDLIQSNNGVKSPAKPSNLKASSGTAFGSRAGKMSRATFPSKADCCMQAWEVLGLLRTV